MSLNLTRPLLIIDAETTGSDPQKDRIVCLSIYPVTPESMPSVAPFYQLINPEMPIPQDATDIHGISDADVKDAPTFKQFVPNILSLLCSECDICGYNLVNFDLPLLIAEMERIGLPGIFPNKTSKIIDPHRIFYNKEPRTLEAAVQKYCGRKHENPHDCLADCRETHQVLLGQLRMYPELANATIDDLVVASRNKGELDIMGKLKLNKRGDLVFNFGKMKNHRILDEQSYAQWMLSGNFLYDTKTFIRAELSKRDLPVDGPWTEQDLAKLKQNYEVGFTVADLSSMLKRTRVDIIQQLAWLNCIDAATKEKLLAKSA